MEETKKKALTYCQYVSAGFVERNNLSNIYIVSQQARFVKQKWAF